MTFYRAQVQSLTCLVSHSVIPSSCWDLVNVTMVAQDSHNLCKSHATSTCLSSCCQFWQPKCRHHFRPFWEECFLLKFLHGFVKIDTWISPSFYMDLSKLFYVFLTLYQSKPSRSLTEISKLVEASALNYKGVEWVKVLNGCYHMLWQCFYW